MNAPPNQPGARLAERKPLPLRAASFDKASPVLPVRSPRLIRWFKRYSQLYVSKHFHAVRLARGTVPPAGDRPCVFYLNHPSWWDPMICSVLVARCFDEREHWGFIEAGELERYRFFSKLGFIGLDTRSRRSTWRLKAVANALRDLPGATLWLTPEGEFTDPRQRPLQLRPGLGLLARWMPEASFVPVAVEYPFWQERCPEALIRFGTPWRPADDATLSVSDYTAEFERRLTVELDALQQLSIGRRADAFELLVTGSAGVNLPYDLWRRLRARFTGRDTTLEHGARSGR